MLLHNRVQDAQILAATGALIIPIVLSSTIWIQVHPARVFERFAGTPLLLRSKRFIGGFNGVVGNGSEFFQDSSGASLASFNFSPEYTNRSTQEDSLRVGVQR